MGLESVRLEGDQLTGRDVELPQAGENHCLRVNLHMSHIPDGDAPELGLGGDSLGWKHEARTGGDGQVTQSLGPVYEHKGFLNYEQKKEYIFRYL